MDDNRRSVDVLLCEEKLPIEHTLNKDNRFRDVVHFYPPQSGEGKCENVQFLLFFPSVPAAWGGGGSGTRRRFLFVLFSVLTTM